MPEAEPAPKTKAPSRPTHLKGEAVAEWKRVVPLLRESGLLAEVDRAQLALYCSAWALFVEADKEVQKGDLITYTEKGYPVQTPWVAIRRGASEEVSRAAGQFGMSPVARTRIHAVLAGDKPLSDKAADLKAIING